MKFKRSKRDREAVQVVEAPPPARTYFGPEEPTLHLECWEDELSLVQLESYKRADQEYNTIKNKLNTIVKESGGEVIFTGDQCAAYNVSGRVPELDELSSASSSYISSAAPKYQVYGKKKREKKDKDPNYIPPSPPPVEPKIKESKKFKSKDKSFKSVSSAPASIQSVSSGVRPSEATAVGGLATGSANKHAIVDLTKDDSKNVPDSREVSFNKLQGKTFPSLVVVARPYLRTKDGTGNSDRASLDSRVKSVLMHTPTKFTEWLIQQGLLRSEQTCSIHAGTLLKLGMYSDISKFPYSGGYVWISECCPSRFVSVFSGSLFEGATHPPSVLLKLIYHWACQTNVQNVVQWVKVDNVYVKSLFTWLRAACTAALHNHINQMGGPGKKIEVGVISLGTTSHDGLQRQVKVEVLGILDTEAKMVRLRAVEPLADGERNYKKRFQKILEPLAHWVRRDSVILTDLTVDKGTLQHMGFKTVYQVSNTDPSTKNSNANVMEYLRRIVPRMFQNTLSLLSRQIIQQFLDELVWRECYGTSPGSAFDNIVQHVAEQTRLEAKDNLVVRLNKISLNPFKHWYFNIGKTVKIVMPSPSVVELPKESKRGRKKKEHTPTPPPSPPPPPKKRGIAKEIRKRKRISYTEAEEDDDVMLDVRRDKKIKKKHEEKIVYEPKKEMKKKQEKRKEEKFRVERKERKKDDLKISIKNITNREENMVDMETYYFGQIEGNIENTVFSQINVQCTECQTSFDNNKDLQLHVFAHVTPFTEFLCKYCLFVGESDESLQTHTVEIHPNVVKYEQLNTYACIICDTHHSSLSILSSHMQKTHTQLELPYLCGVCGYRVSSHRACVDHYYSEHQNSATLQCPHCLKVVKAFADGCDLQGNIASYINHLKNHKDRDPLLKCSRCSLYFLNLGALRDHQLKHHSSILAAKFLCNQGFMINKPKNKATPPIKNISNHAFIDIYDDIALDIPDGYLCKECDSQLEDDKHFLGTTKCNKCSFQTGCWKTILQHSGMCQSKSNDGKSKPLPNTMHCICSFSSNDGNVLAEHLALCERQTAYVSEEKAKDNTATVCLAKQSMMDSLCLQRNKDVDFSISSQVENITDYSAPPSILNTQLSLDDLAPPSVLQSDQMDIDNMKNEPYEQPLATPQVRHEEMDMVEPPNVQSLPDAVSESSGSAAMTEGQSLDSYMDGTGEFEPLPAEPMPQPEFEPL